MAQHTTLSWRTSSFTDGMQCVQVAKTGDGVALRDSKDPDGPVLHFSSSAMLAFVNATKAGEIDDLA